LRGFASVDVRPSELLPKQLRQIIVVELHLYRDRIAV
jgi:hypothetical protein